MRKILIFLILSIGLLAGVIWLADDERLSEESRTWRDWHDLHLDQPGEAWLWLLGLQAPAGHRPDDAGSRWLEQARRELAASDDQAATVLLASLAPWHDRPLPLPDESSLEQLLGTRDRQGLEMLDAFLAEHAELLDRFREWPAQTRSLVVAAPDSRNLPPMQALVAAVELDRLAQLGQLLRGEPEQALALAEHSDRQLRALLAAAPNRIVLMTAVRLLADQTEWLLTLHRDGLIELWPDTPMLADLDQVAQGLEAALRGEFGLSYRFNQVFEEPDLGEDAGWWDRLKFRWLYKPDMTLNRTVNLYRWVAALHRPTDLAALGQGNEPIWPVPQQPRNLFAYGRYNMLPEAQPFLAYVGRIHDLSARLALARGWLAEPVLDEPALNRIVRLNPYRRGHGIRLEAQARLLCFEGPFRDPEQLRCIGLADES